jgi:type III secretion protein V
MTGARLITAAGMAVTAAVLLLPLPGAALDGLTLAGWAAAGWVAAAAVAGMAGPVPEPWVARTAAALPTALPAAGLLRLLILAAGARTLAAGGEVGFLADALGGMTNTAEGGTAALASAWPGLAGLAALGVLQFAVIAKGAERAGEVAARFALDALPGAQAAIEADLRAGAVDAYEAGRRRAALDRRSRLAGSLDSALRFVRGEAVAAPLLLLVLLVAGFGGAKSRGAGVAEVAAAAVGGAVGLGLAQAIPAALAGAGAILLIPRAVGGDGDGPRDDDLAGRLRPRPPEPVTLELGAAVAGLFDASETRSVLPAALRDLADRSGVPFPVPVVRPSADLPPRGWRLLIHGLQTASGECSAVAGPSAAAAGLAASAAATLRRRAADFLGLQEVRGLLDSLERTHPALVRETLSRAAPLPRLAALLRRLAGEGVPLRDLRAVLEAALARAAGQPDDQEAAELMRIELRRQIAAPLMKDGTLAVHLADADLEEAVRESLRKGPDGVVRSALEPELLAELRVAVRAASTASAAAGVPTAVLAEAGVRPHLRRLLEDEFPDAAVISYAELPPDCRVRPLGRLSV